MFPRWMKWLFILFLGYLLFIGHRAVQVESVAPAAPKPAAEGEAKTYPSLAAAFDVDRWRRGINPHYVSPAKPCAVPTTTPDALGFTVIDEAPGEGAAAACGDAISVRLMVWSPTGHVAYAGELPLTLGENKVAVGLDAGLVGLAVHGQRLLILPPSALAHAESSHAPAALLKALPAGRVAMVRVTRLK